MGRINILPERIIGRIAAGEAVERPASVIKECIENSIDAGAQNILTEIQKAGKVMISVRDDGEGIEPEDIGKLFRRHATSKISDAEDLYNINSFGFRGEALYSIASVSDIIIKSRRREKSGTGKEIHFRGGKEISVKDAGITPGTTVEIRELFFNTPARKKFMKADSTELRHIINVFVQYVLAFPENKFSLKHNGRTIAEYSPSENVLSRLSDVLKIDKKNILTGTKKDEGFSLELFLGDINIKRPRRDQQYIFINKRPVYSQSISYRLNGVYKALLPREMSPVFAVFLSTPADNIDVNIHPTKKEVKLKNEIAVSSSLSLMAQEILLGKSGAASVKKEVMYFPHRNIDEGKSPKVTPYQETIQKEEMDIFHAGKQRTETAESFPAVIPIKTRLEHASYAGSYKNKYLFFEAGDTLLVIDQHAAHERVNYEKLKKQFESGKIEIQQLLSPVIIKLSEEEMASWEEARKKIEEIGFTVKRKEKDSIAIQAFPYLIKNPETAIRSILAERNIEYFDREKLARKACRGSVLSGDRITPEDAVQLKKSLMECEVPFVCPHGRPTVVEFTESFFDRQFLR